jgi:AraC-like DNA-binding protein
MGSHNTKPVALHSEAETSAQLFHDWFDPIEMGVRAQVRSFIEGMIEAELEAALSRSVMAERFTQLVGLPPMHYLAKWRMQIASELLTSSNANIARIAAETGYGCEESFNRAFKKMVGVAPTAWPRRGS